MMVTRKYSNEREERRNYHVDQYVYLGVKIPRRCSWDTHESEEVEKGKAQMSKMDAIILEYDHIPPA